MSIILIKHAKNNTLQNNYSELKLKRIMVGSSEYIIGYVEDEMETVSIVPYQENAIVLDKDKLGRFIDTLMNLYQKMS